MKWKYGLTCLSILVVGAISFHAFARYLHARQAEVTKVEESQPKLDDTPPQINAKTNVPNELISQPSGPTPAQGTTIPSTPLPNLTTEESDLDLAISTTTVLDLTKALGNSQHPLAKLEFVFYQDIERRAVECILIRHVGRVYAVTALAAGKVQDHLPKAIDRLRVDRGQSRNYPAQFVSSQSAGLYFASVQTPAGETVPTVDAAARTPDLKAGFELTAISLKLQDSGELLPVGKVVRIDSIEQTRDITLGNQTTHKLHNLMELSTSLREGTPLYWKDRLAGIVVLGERELGEQTPRSLALPLDAVLRDLREVTSAEAQKSVSTTITAKQVIADTAFDPASLARETDPFTGDLIRGGDSERLSGTPASAPPTDPPSGKTPSYKLPENTLSTQPDSSNAGSSSPGSPSVERRSTVQAGDGFNLIPPVHQKIISLRSLDADEAAQTLSALYSDSLQLTRIAANRGTRSVIVSAPEDVLKQIMTTIEELELRADQLQPKEPTGRAVRSPFNPVLTPKTGSGDERLHPAIDSLDLEQQTYDLSAQARSASEPSKKEKLLEELQRLVEQHFDERQSERQREIDDLSQRLDRLKATHARRNKSKAEIVKRRVSELLGESDELDWGQPSPSQLRRY